MGFGLTPENAAAQRHDSYRHEARVDLRYTLQDVHSEVRRRVSENHHYNEVAQLLAELGDTMRDRENSGAYRNDPANAPEMVVQEILDALQARVTESREAGIAAPEGSRERKQHQRRYTAFLRTARDLARPQLTATAEAAIEQATKSEAEFA